MEKDRGKGGGGRERAGSSTTLAPLFLLNPLASTNLVGRREEGEATLMRGSPPPRKDGGRRTRKAQGQGERKRRKKRRWEGRPVLLRQRKQGKREGGNNSRESWGGVRWERREGLISNVVCTLRGLPSSVPRGPSARCSVDVCVPRRGRGKETERHGHVSTRAQRCVPEQKGGKRDKQCQGKILADHAIFLAKCFPSVSPPKDRGRSLATPSQIAPFSLSLPRSTFPSSDAAHHNGFTPRPRPLPFPGGAKTSGGSFPLAILLLRRRTQS